MNKEDVTSPIISVNKEFISSISKESISKSSPMKMNKNITVIQITDVHWHSKKIYALSNYKL